MQGLTREGLGLLPGSSSSENDADESSAEETVHPGQTQEGGQHVSASYDREEKTGDKGEHSHQNDGNDFSDLFSDFSSLDFDGDQRKQENVEEAKNDDPSLSVSSDVHPISDQRDSVQDAFDGKTTTPYSGRLSPESVDKGSRVSEDWPQRSPSLGSSSETATVQSEQTSIAFYTLYAVLLLLRRRQGKYSDAYRQRRRCKG